MKPYILLIIASFLLSSCTKETKYQLPPDEYLITVKAPEVLNGIRAYIRGVDPRNRQINLDTAMVINESFTFSGKVGSPSIRLITVDGIKNNLPFVLEEGITNIDLDKNNISNSIIDGPINNQGFQKYNAEFKRRSEEITTLRAQMSQARNDGNNDLVSELMQKNMELGQELMNYTYDFVDDNAHLNFALLLLESQMSARNHDVERLKGNLLSLKDVISSSPQNQLIGQKLNAFVAAKEAEAKTNIGQAAPNFTSTTPDGETLSLNDIKGKVTLIDFWASWCKPCRRENPNIVRVYEKFHDKGLEVIGVSLDREGQKDRWLKAIEDDKLPWHHVGSLKYWNEPVAKMYNVSSIPAAFILDENGVIVAKSLRGAALENKIAELLGGR